MQAVCLLHSLLVSQQRSVSEGDIDSICLSELLALTLIRLLVAQIVAGKVVEGERIKVWVSCLAARRHDQMHSANSGHQVFTFISCLALALALLH